MNDLQKRGYLVKETGAVYYSMDMDKTLAWFTDVLGWYGQIDAHERKMLEVYTHLGFDDAKDEMIRLEELEAAKKEVEKVTGEKPITQKMFKAI